MATIFKSQGFEIILKGRNCCPYTGKESIELLGNGIKLFKDEFGSERYVLYINRKAVSALQLMISENVVTVANVITLPVHRQKGFAKKLWSEAKKRHVNIVHSNNLSEEGKIFSNHCK